MILKPHNTSKTFAGGVGDLGRGSAPASRNLLVPLDLAAAEPYFWLYLRATAPAFGKFAEEVPHLPESCWPRWT